MSKPNIFDFATSELSQDAILCWLASWAGPRASGHDERRIALGRAFLQAIFAKHSLDLPATIAELRIKRQYKNIDVLVVINGVYAVCIEDKVGTVEHSDQLARYVATLKDDGYSPSNILPIYVQTHEQATFDAARQAGYAVLDRADFLNLLHPYVHDHGEDSLESDFYLHLLQIDTQVNAFKVSPLSEWPWLAWQGFFGEVRRRLGAGRWAYLPNQSGGFLAFWWHERVGVASRAYLQLEMASLCFKVATNAEASASRAKVRDAWSRRILHAAEALDVRLARPRRLGNGRTMTVASLEGDYRVAGPDGVLGVDRTLDQLEKAQRVLDRAANEEAEKL